MEVPQQKGMEDFVREARMYGDLRFLPFSTLQWRSEKSPLKRAFIAALLRELLGSSRRRAEWSVI